MRMVRFPIFDCAHMCLPFWKAPCPKQGNRGSPQQDGVRGCAKTPLSPRVGGREMRRRCRAGPNYRTMPPLFEGPNLRCQAPPPQARPASLVPPPPTPHLPHPLLYPHAHPHAPAHATPALPTRRLAALPCCLEVVSHPPLRGPGPYLRRALGCSEVVSRGIRVIPAPRGSNPRSRFNVQAAPRFGPQNSGSNPSCTQPHRHSTSIQPPSCTGHGRRVPRHGGAGKKTLSTIQIKSNPPPQPCHRKVWVQGLPCQAEGPGLPPKAVYRKLQSHFNGPSPRRGPATARCGCRARPAWLTPWRQCCYPPTHISTKRSEGE